MRWRSFGVAATLVVSGLIAGCLEGNLANAEPLDALPLNIPGLANEFDLAELDHSIFGNGYRTREFDVATDPNNPDRLAAGYLVMTPGTIWLGIARSEDGGATWKYQTFCGDPILAADAAGWPVDCPFLGAWAMGDPVLWFLPDGTLVYGFLRITVDSINVQVMRFKGDGLDPDSVHLVARSAHNEIQGGQNIPSPYATYYNDKEQFDYDEKTNTLYLAWSGIWRHRPPASQLNPTRGFPFVSKSIDGGITWTTPVGVIGDFIDTTQNFDVGFNMGSWPIVTRDGALHVFWLTIDNGNLWRATAKDTVHFDPPILLNASKQENSAIMGGVGIPSVGIDESGGPYDGTIYVGYTAQYGDDQDVYIIFSRDHGVTWGEPVRVNDDPIGNQRDQFLPELVVEPSGAVSFLFYDQRDVSDPEHYFDAYLARSIDGGQSFKNVQVSTASSCDCNISKGRLVDEAHLFENVGDYNGISYNRDSVIPMWQDQRDFPTGFIRRIQVDG